MATAPERPRNPRGEGARLREQLLAGAAEVLDDVGDASRVSVRAIAQRAGVSPTALYLHFPDRDALVDAAVDAGFAAFNDGAADGRRARRVRPRRRLEAMGLAYLAFAERQPALYAILFSARRPAAPGGARAATRASPAWSRSCGRAIPRSMTRGAEAGVRRVVEPARLRHPARRPARVRLAVGRALRAPHAGGARLARGALGALSARGCVPSWTAMPRLPPCLHTYIATSALRTSSSAVTSRCRRARARCWRRSRPSRPASSNGSRERAEDAARRRSARLAPRCRRAAARRTRRRRDAPACPPRAASRAAPRGLAAGRHRHRGRVCH